MAIGMNIRIWLLKLLVFGATLVPLSESRPMQYGSSQVTPNPPPNFRIRGVNLGGWLLVEGWIKPSLFQAIPNKDFLDGTTLQFKSVTTKKYLCPQSGGGTIVVANCITTASGWENIRLWRINETTFRFRVAKDQFVGLDGTKVVATIVNPDHSATFEIIKESENSTRVRIKASNGFFLQAKSEKLVTADVSNLRSWKDNDPTVFNLTIVSQLDGDFQLQNGYGHKAFQVMKEHYDTFITEKDFKFIVENGINAVRIPVGWWAAKDPNPPFPFVSGTLQALDNAFSWAKKYGLKVILDLHSAPGFQNDAASSATRDGSIEWGKTNESIQGTLEIIDFFAARYTKHESLYAIELLNEPLAPYVSFETITGYYKAGYEVVRKYSSTVYVLFSVRLTFTEVNIPPPQELFPLTNGLWRVVLDIHWYHIYYDIFNDMTAKQNIDYVYYNRTLQLNQLLNAEGAPLTYIGEWSDIFNSTNATEEEYKRFAEAQKQLYDRATFGWSFWTLKNVKNHWSFEWMIKHGYIKLI